MTVISLFSNRNRNRTSTQLGSSISGLFRIAIASFWYFNATFAIAADNKVIEWAIVDWPPIYILKNGAVPQSPQQLGNGVVDRQLAEIIARMPQYRHTFVLSNVQRILSGFAKGETLCYASAFKTPEREAIAYFTESTTIPTVNIIVRSDRRPGLRLSEPAISLKSLVFTRTDLVGYIESMRSYGPSIDPLLGTAGENVKFLKVAAPGELVRTLDAGRMDYILEYPMVVEYKRRLEHYEHAFDVIQLEDAPALAVGSIACSRNAWGKQAIADIANAVRDAAHSPSYRNSVSDWLPESMVKAVRPKMEEFYDKLIHAPVTAE